MACACTCDGKGHSITKGVLDVLGTSCHEREKEPLSVEVEESTKSRELGATDKICHSACSGKYTPEADEPHGENEGSAAVEAEPGLEDEAPAKFGPTGEEAMGDTCHHNL